jgi:hypothetical protein
MPKGVEPKTLDRSHWVPFSSAGAGAPARTAEPDHADVRGKCLRRLYDPGASPLRGMAEVYLADHPRLPRKDALKVLPAQVSADAEFVTASCAKPTLRLRSGTRTSSASTIAENSTAS